ncbi:hypothetical protein [Pantoea dispersa]|uniref:hypothetical protein n=1 Tax=Pantoea dispersa TaxID=59814 RepID=UPI000FDB1143|nr:hypothetical protein [Pantoea dispersa]MDI6634264.1 hypothetical protein [Pantoea dispersa]RVU72959.1 hypothetical protein EKH82_22605 [Pantoea dispersa]
MIIQLYKNPALLLHDKCAGAFQEKALLNSVLNNAFTIYTQQQMYSSCRGPGKINDNKRTANTAFRMNCKNNDESRGTQQGALFLQDKRQSGQRRTGSLDKKQDIAGRRVRAIAVTGFSARLSQRSGVVRQGPGRRGR